MHKHVGRMLHIGFDGLEPPDYVLEWLAQGQVGGIVLFRRNIDTPEQLVRLIETCRAAAMHDLLVSIDQEGGRVVRLHTDFSESPGAMALGCTDSEAHAQAVAHVLGTEMHALGINWVLAPVVDLTYSPDNAAIGTRSLGSDSARVSALSVAQVQGFQQAGIAATAKHFPGHGNTPVDTHVRLAVVRGALDFLWQQDLKPFRAAIEAQVAAVMVSHIRFETLDPVYPASLSPVLIQQLLRGELGFRGVVCSDCMEMNAITAHYGVAEATLAAVNAGQDIIFYSHSVRYQQQAYDTLVEALDSGRLTEARLDASLRRIDRMIARFPLTPRPPLSVIRQPEHLRVMRDTARDAVAVLKQEATVFPLRPEVHRLGLVEFSSLMDTPALESGGTTALLSVLKQDLPNIEAISLVTGAISAQQQVQTLALARQVDVLLLATRNVHLRVDERQLAQTLIHVAPHTVLICLADPYDVDMLLGAGTMICTCGDSQPLLAALVEVLMGHISARGKVPVIVGQH